MTVTNAVVKNNIVVNVADTGIQFRDITTSISDYNCIFDCPQPYFGEITPFNGGAHDIQVDPQFVDAITNDYHLQPGSPCIDAGDPESNYDLEPQPNGNRINMGAYGNTHLAAPSDQSLGNIIYVDVNNDNIGDGSQSNPYNSIQQAVDNSIPGDDIWVAAGTYYENVRIDSDHPDLGLYGGFHPETWERDIEVHQTLVDAMESSWAILTGAPHTEISGFWARNATTLIYIGSGASHSTIERNYLFDTIDSFSNYTAGIRIDTVTDITFRNNVIFNILAGIGHGIAAAIHYEHFLEYALIENNTIYNTSSDGIIIGRTYAIANNVLLRNNIVANSGATGIQFRDITTSVADYNCVFNCAEPYYGEITPFNGGPHDIQVNPQFVESNNPNFHLQPGSPCIDAGDPASDYSNEPQPNGNRINMGAYGNTYLATLSEQPQDVYLVSVPTVYGQPNQVTPVPIYVHPTTGVTGAHFSLFYNPAIINPLEAYTTDNFILAANFETPGQAIISLAGSEPMNGDAAILCHIAFEVITDDVGAASGLELDNVHLYNTDGQNLLVEVDHGQFILGSGKGDVNADNHITVPDVNLTLQIAVGLYEPTEDEFFRADFDDNGEVNSADAMAILQITAGFEPDLLPGGADGHFDLDLSYLWVSGYAGESVTLPVRLRGQTDWRAADLDIQFDRTRFELLDISEGDMCPTGLMVANTSALSPKISLLRNDTGLQTDGTLLSLTFRLLSDVENDPIDVAVTMFDTNGRPIRIDLVGTQSALLTLFQNYPNPFVELTTIQFQLSSPTNVTARVYSITGQLVRTLSDHTPMESGSHQLFWNGRTNDGSEVASGVYIISLKAGSIKKRQQVLLVR